VHLRSRLIMALNCILKFTRSQPSNTSLSSLNPRLQGNLQTVNHALQVCIIMAAKCISTLGRSRPLTSSLSSLNLTLHVHFQTRSVTVPDFISNIIRSWPGSGSRISPDVSLQVQIQSQLIIASNCIFKLTRLQPRMASPSLVLSYWCYSNISGIIQNHLMIHILILNLVSRIITRISLLDLPSGYVHLLVIHPLPDLGID